jgi:hypothetical protein
MSACVLYSSAIGMCNFTRQRGIRYVGTWSITTRRHEAGAARQLCGWVSRALEARPADTPLHVPSACPRRHGMPVEGTFQGRETSSTTGWSSQGSIAESFCVCVPCVLEVRWSQWSGMGEWEAWRGRGELRKRVNRRSRISRR